MSTIPKKDERMIASDPKSIHGFLCDPSWPLPKCVTSSSVINRPDQSSTTTSSEYQDDPEILDQKLDILIDLIKKSKCFTAYTGAGLSRASGIGDYASKAKDSIVNTPKVINSMFAKPNFGHMSLTALEKAGYLKHFVQQNHDGLPQKSGFPQTKMNEIHGAWFDPSNPVVKFGESLRSDLFKDMIKLEENIDLCLTLGTSLSGMNADRIASTPAKRSIKKEVTQQGNTVLGTVLINLQQTHLDGKCCVRIWAPINDAMTLLMKKLNLFDMVQNMKQSIPTFKKLKFTIPYDRDGFLSETEQMVLDLNPDSKFRIPVKDATNYNNEGRVVKFNSDQGIWILEINEKNNGPTSSPFKFVTRHFGYWWIQEAEAGRLKQLPLVNLNPYVTKKIIPKTEKN